MLCMYFDNCWKESGQRTGCFRQCCRKNALKLIFIFLAQILSEYIANHFSKRSTLSHCSDVHLIFECVYVYWMDDPANDSSPIMINNLGSRIPSTKYFERFLFPKFLQHDFQMSITCRQRINSGSGSRAWTHGVGYKHNRNLSCSRVTIITVCIQVLQGLLKWITNRITCSVLLIHLSMTDRIPTNIDALLSHSGPLQILMDDYSLVTRDCLTMLVWD